MVKVKLLAPNVIAIETPGKVAEVTFAQAREIIVGLAQAMDDGSKRAVEAECFSAHGDSVITGKINGGIEVVTHGDQTIYLRKGDAIRFALAMLSFAGEINGE